MYSQHDGLVFKAPLGVWVNTEIIHSFHFLFNGVHVLFGDATPANSRVRNEGNILPLPPPAGDKNTNDLRLITNHLRLIAND